jgi:hypothetical protein
MSKLEDMAWNQESFRTSAIFWQVKLFEAIIIIVVVIIIIIISSTSRSRSQQLSPRRGPESSPWLHLGMASGQMIGGSHEKGGKKGGLIHQTSDFLTNTHTNIARFWFQKIDRAVKPTLIQKKYHK